MRGRQRRSIFTVRVWRAFITWICGERHHRLLDWQTGHSGRLAGHGCAGISMRSICLRWTESICRRFFRCWRNMPDFAATCYKRRIKDWQWFRRHRRKIVFWIREKQCRWHCIQKILWQLFEICSGIIWKHVKY